MSDATTKRRIPELPAVNLDRIEKDLIQTSSGHLLLPSPDVVASLGASNVFATIRAHTGHPRGTVDSPQRATLMYDDNTTPRWALLWTHGIIVTHHPSEYVVAHVWPAVRDVNAYTNVANLVLVPSCLSSPTDGQCILARYLRYHAWDKYGWHPIGEQPPQRPEHYTLFEQSVVYMASKTSTPLATVVQYGQNLTNARIATLIKHGLKPF